MAEVEKETDEVLVKRIKKGEVLAFELLLNRYQAKMLRFVRRWLEEAEDREEVVQDIFLKFYKAIGKVDTKKKVSAYLYGIAKNVVIDKLRKQKKTLPLFEEVVGDTDEGMLEVLAKEEQNRSLYRALSQLKDNYRKVIRLYYFEELSYQSIQQKLSWPLNTVRTNLKRAKKALAKKMIYEKKK